jgi:hypothetical protein
MGTGVKRPRLEPGHSPPTSAKVKRTWIYAHCPIRLHGVVLKNRENFTSSKEKFPFLRPPLPEALHGRGAEASYVVALCTARRNLC